MLFMIVNRTRQNLTPEEATELASLAQSFYQNIPEGIVLHGDWAASDRSCTFSLLEADSREALEQIQEPFRRFVDMDLVAVERVTGWGER